MHHPPLPRSLRALLDQVVDYAGLFPPAGLGMTEAVARYAAYTADPDAWMLGRFVVPASRLDEFAGAARPHLRGGARWRLSALVGPETGDDLARVAEFDAGIGGVDGAVVDTVEAKVATPAGVERLAAALPPGITAFVEIPASADPAPLLAAVAAARLAAKVRTGGVTGELFPSAGSLARFLGACLDARVPFKATAGLHHPLRAEYRLTYEAGSAECTMFGYVNLFLAAVLLREGMPAAELPTLLEERDAGRLRFTDDGVRWGDHAATTDAIAEARARFAISFGSCSFREPVDEARLLWGR